MPMRDHVHEVIEIAGSSETSISAAIETAIRRASQTVRHLRWFEVKQMRGRIEDGNIKDYQVVLQVGFTLEER